MVVHCNSKVYIYIYILCCIHTGQNILIFSFSFLFFSFSPHFSILYIAPLSSLFISLVASSSSFTHHQPKPLPSIDLHSLRFSPLSLSLSLSLSHFSYAFSLTLSSPQAQAPSLFTPCCCCRPPPTPRSMIAQQATHCLSSSFLPRCD